MRLLATIFALGLVSGCNTLAPDEGGTYDVVGYNEGGEALFFGLFFLDFERLPDDDDGQYTIGGDWILEPAEGGHVPGPESAGSLDGSIDADGRAFIGLNPGFADFNVFVFGSFADFAVLEGEWQLSLFTGPAAGGRIVVTRR